MKIAIVHERKLGEKRVAATPDSVRKYRALNAEVTVESGAGLASGITDNAYADAGAIIAHDAQSAVENATIILKVSPLALEEIVSMPFGVNVIGMLDPYTNAEMITAFNTKKISAFSLELLPRISRAQSMDVLSSQSNLAGYRAVIDAVALFGKVMSMMMTAAGTVAPAKVLVLGAGVAGLQAIATAKRLGAVVSAFDVRAVAKEQVESLGAKFIEVQAEGAGETTGGYAKEMSDDYKRAQSQLIHDTLKKQDMVISTALIPGKPAPVLITEEMVKDMKPGSVIVDLAAASGGNCPLTELGKVVEKYGVTLVGYGDMPSRVAVDASQLYSRNLLNFVSTLILPDIKWEDELIIGTLLTKDGMTVHKNFV